MSLLTKQLWKEKEGFDVHQELVYPFIKDKIVLDISTGNIVKGSYHEFLKKHCKKLTGVELDSDKAKVFIDESYDVKIGNAETIKLNEKFDVITASKMIEHLDNVGLFLDNMKEHLKDDGILIINTNNIYCINYLLKGLFGLGKVYQYPEHTCGFEESLLKENMNRHGFEVFKVDYFNYKRPDLESIFTRTLAFPSKKLRENIIIFMRKRK